MALTAKLLAITSPTSTGSVGYTGLGFDPREGKSLVIFGYDRSESEGYATTGYLGIGAAVSASARNAISCMFRNARTVADNGHCGRATSAAACIRQISFTGSSILLEADFVSWDADGFTLDWTTVLGASTLVSALVLNSEDAGVDFAVGNGTSPASAGDQDIAVGFNPTAFLMYSAGATTSLPSTSSTIDPQFAIGWAVGSGHSFSGVTGTPSPGGSPTDVEGRQRTNQLFAWPAVGASPSGEVTLVSLTSVTNNVRVNWSSTPGAGRHYFWVAMKGIAAAMGTATQPTSNGAQALATGITPKAVLFLSGNKVADTGNTAHARLSLGMSDGTAQAARFVGSEDANATASVTARGVTYSAGLVMAVETGGGAATASATVAFDAEDVDLTWGTTDATAREFLWLALGDEPAPDPPPTGGPAAPSAFNDGFN